MKRLLLLSVLALAGCDFHTPSPRYATAPMYLLDIAPERLAGTWYEVASFPAPFQDGCSHTTATYAVIEGGLSVVNRCRQGGQLVQITGTAVPVGPGQLKVKLGGVPFAGDYWVIGQSRDGRTVLVGTPTRLAGWMLHRDPVVTEAERRWAAEVFARNGYDAAALQRTEQR
ncbi:lipocalin family protein [Pseudorhodobacter sp. MZDSW-24AT]|uniref:lipocalin family protein n=1 Tax=Pseudorhodobacter sp. MZDSW-24AT TaxID=2052957 RepID=UPI000C1EB543|nr:lipocalin family protein [Pseudorhodobacter sp. MZDSW-24AT]PJF09183.1 lipocalin [Pseudorhodobacter sp. MZDSW-24AT]